jgi:hypothetical protein
MKSFRVSNGMVKIDGVTYGILPKEDVRIMGKSGVIHSILIEGKGQFFPIAGVFDENPPVKVSKK